MTDFSKLVGLDPDEVITHSYVRDVRMPSGKTIALITLDNGRDHTRPSTLGPATLLELSGVLDALKVRAAEKEIDGVAVIGKQFIFAAGADLSKVEDIPDRETGVLMAKLGHETLGKLSELGVPSFVFYNGLALGGGVEIGLNADYRTIDSSVPAFALPEVFLGIIPGWGGAWILPNLIGIENALEVIISNPLKNNRMLKAPQVLELGIADAMFGPANFLEDSLKWADGVLTGKTKVKRKNEPGKIERAVKWDVAIGIADKMLASRIGRVAKSPYRALELLKAAKNTDKKTGFAAEDEALADLISGDQFRASIYAFNLVQKRAKKPAGAPDKALARPVTKVDDLLGKGRIGSDEANRLKALVTGTTDKADFADCDWVIEAVFEELGVKQTVFADVEKHISPEAILATNTSSLSVEQIGAKLKHPERVVGFHFFNPVAVMPLIEVVKTPKTTDEVLATAMATAAKLRKNAVITADTPGFVVNRILAKLLGEAMHAVEIGTPFDTVVEAVKPFGLPMDPFVLLELVGLKVGAHVLDTHHTAFPDRFFESPALHELAEFGHLFEKDAKGKSKGIDPKVLKIVEKHRIAGSTPYTAEELRTRVEDGLADEIHRMLEDKVVAAPEDIDLCLILGAGWPFQMGGATPYLDRVGASERVFGSTFHTPRIVGVA
jgi:3-hydroxyacyl-CoA dehydrogenase/enoyl-CoA hydratase/carnithine racemase